MDKINNAIRRNQQLRGQKDALKKELKNDFVPAIDFSGIIVPKILHEPSVVDRAMQWYFNGFVMSFGDGVLVVDPGVDFYSRFTTTGMTVKDVRGIFVSHEHLDHCGDLLVFIDMIAKTQTSIDLILPVTVVDGVLPPYYRTLIQEHESINLIILRDGDHSEMRTQWAILSTLEIIQLYHSTQHTFGFRLKCMGETVAYISDTGYATKLKTPSGEVSPRDIDGSFDLIIEKHEKIKEFVRDADVLICNINDLFYNRHSLTHLSGWDLADMLAGSGVHRLLLLHLSPYDANGDDSSGIYVDFFDNIQAECYIPDGSELKMSFHEV